HVLKPQSAFAQFVEGDGTPPARQVYYRTRIFPQLQAAGIPRGPLYLAWDFTVASRQSLSETALFMRDDALAKLGDTTPSDGTVQGDAPSFTIESCSVAVTPAPAGCTTSTTLDPRVYAHIAGHVTAPCYLNEPGCPPGARFQYSGANATLPSPIPGTTISANFQCNVPIGAENGEAFQPMMNGHGLFGTASQVNSDELYALGSSRLMACATDEDGHARGEVPE